MSIGRRKSRYPLYCIFDCNPVLRDIIFVWLSYQDLICYGFWISTSEGLLSMLFALRTR
jgi:hypothetical protein